MRIIDDGGDLFGLVNAVAAIAFLLVPLALIAGVTTAHSTSEADPKTRDRKILTQVVTVQIGSPNRTVASAIQPGPVGTRGIVAVEGCPT